MAIAVILTVIGYVNIGSRMRTSRLDQAVQTISADLTYARSAAMLKGCPTRIIFCTNKACSDTNVSAASPVSGGGALISNSVGTTAARFYAIQRYSQAVNALSSEGCYNEAAVNALGDGFDYWDFDRRPVELPLGVGFVPIYGSDNDDVPDQSDWSSTTSSAAGNSLWFNRSGVAQLNSVENANVAGSSTTYRIMFQVTLDNCEVTGSTDADCLAYLVSMPPDGGTATFTKCNFGASRVAGTSVPSNNCF